MSNNNMKVIGKLRKDVELIHGKFEKTDLRKIFCVGLKNLSDHVICERRLLNLKLQKVLNSR